MTPRNPVEFTDEQGRRVGNKVTLAADIGGAETDLLIDEKTGALATLDVIHHEVHEAEMYIGEYSASVLNGASLNIRLLTSTGGSHTTFEINVGGQSLLYIYEAATISGGTTLAVYNMNRQDTPGPQPFQMWHTPIVMATGTTALVNGRLLAGGTSPTTRVGTGSRPGLEWILKVSTEYLIRVTNNSGATIVVNVVVNGYIG